MPKNHFFFGQRTEYFLSLTRPRKYRDLTADERLIGKRVRQVRSVNDLNQKEFGARIGLSRDQLTNIEIGRVALRFAPGWRVCLEFDVNPLWLAFDGAFEAVGWNDYNFPEREDARDFLAVITDYKEAYLSLRATFRRAGSAPLILANTAALNVKQHLTPDETLLKGRSMNLQKNALWLDLRRRLAAVTGGPGVKAQLARELGVSRQAVNEWLSRTAPSAGLTLRLLQWVTAAEAKQKQSAGSVSDARPAHVTRARKSKHEKPNSDRKKKYR